MQIVATWGSLVQTGATLCRLAKLVAIWSNLVQVGATWCTLVQLGADWCKLVLLGATKGGLYNLLHFRETFYRLV